MKYVRLLSIIAILSALLLSVPTVSAQGPGGSWVTGITCQNLSTTTAAGVSFAFYQEGQATPALTYPDTIPAGGTLKYFTPNSPVGLPSPFSGSLTISSDQPVTCNANLQSTGTGTAAAPYRIGTASGFDSTQTAPTMYVPQITKTAAWNTYIAVQNAGSSSTTFTVHYFGRDDGLEIAAAQEQYTIDPNSSKVVYPASNGNLPSTWYGSATIVAGQPLAVIATMYNSGANYQNSQFLVYDAFSSGSGTIYIPRVMRRYYGYNSGITIQNVGTVDTTITVSLTFKDGSAYSWTTPTVKSKASYIIYATNIAALNPVDSLAMQNRTGAGKAVANAPGALIVGIINSDNRGDPNDNNQQAVPVENIGKGATVNMGIDGKQTTKVFLAQVPKRAGGIFTGGVIISNTTGTATTCTFDYTGVPAASQTLSLPANGQISFFLANVPNLPDGFNASVTATCGQAVFGVGNLSADAGTGSLGDSYTENNGFNQ